MLSSFRGSRITRSGKRAASMLALALLLLASVAFGGCQQKPDPVTPAVSAPANQPPADYVQKRRAYERPMPMNTQTGR